MRSSLDNSRAVGDAFQTWNFDLFVPSMPGGGDSRSFSAKIQTTSVPGVTIEPVIVPLHGNELLFAGREVFAHTLEATVLETRDMSTRNAVRRWMSFARSQRKNSGTFKSQYAVTVELVLYDDIPSPVKSIFLESAWPSAIGDLALDGSASTAGSYSVTFSYDTHFETDVA